MHVDDRIWLSTGSRSVDPARVAVTTAPAVELWLASDAVVQQHLKLDSTDDEARASLILAAARKHFEKLTGLALITQTFTVTFDRAPSGREIELPRAPFQSVDAVSYLDENGASAVFDLAGVSTVNAAVPGTFGRCVLKPTASWPDLGDYRGALSIEFTAGFGDAATDVPEDIRLAVLWIAAWWYEMHAPVNVGNIVNELPHHLSALIESHRVAFIA